MSLYIAKFGGSSLTDKEKRAMALQQVRALKERGSVVAVVSAMGRKGAPYATDTLLGLISPETDMKTKDLLMSCGETISACVFASELNSAGLGALAMSAPEAGICARGGFGSADITGLSNRNIEKALEAGLIPVITGFQGLDADSRVHTLGRGGSDTSAVALGGLLGADEVHIFTDVPGIADKDPKTNPDAVFYEELSYDDALSMAENGAKVIHPRAVALGKQYSVPVRVRCTFDNAPGTIIK